MANTDNVVFNIAAFIGGLFVLEFGADKFIDHTAKIASRTGIPPTLIALLTAGAEWEEVRWWPDLAGIVRVVTARRSAMVTSEVKKAA